MIVECAITEVAGQEGEGAARALKLRTHPHRPPQDPRIADPKLVASAGAVAAVVAGKYTSDDKIFILIDSGFQENFK